MFHPEGPRFTELVHQALSSTRRGYDLLAPRFDHTPFRTPDALLDAVGPLLGAPGSVDRAVDLCCGTGAGVRMLRPLCRGEVVGVDFSEGMLEVARQSTPDAPDAAPVSYVHADVLDLPYSGAFELATCFGALGHLVGDDRERFVDNVHRALVPGGRFAFVTHDMPPVWSPVRWLARGFNAAMHVRNALIRPPFVMFYLAWTLPEVGTWLEGRGFSVAVHPLGDGPFRLVVATRA